MFGYPVLPADLSPAHWPAEEKVRAEAAEISRSSAPPQIIEGDSGLVTATISPIAVEAGIEALRKGGTAADAAATVALTQVTTALGSYVSAAGILQLVYYDAGSGKVAFLNAGWNSWLGETDPGSIPRNAPGFQTDPSATHDAEGRKTLVPGFMAGIEAMQKRFGRLPFADVFQPAIWYAENGVTVTPVHAVYFHLREKVLSRTEEGRQFLHQAGDPLPHAGDRFIQPEFAKTLRGVARDGAAYMYTGPWGQQYVDRVKRESGKAGMDDMRRYQPIWEEPLSTTFLGNAVFAPGENNEGGYAVLEALNLVEARKTYEMGPYWKDWKAFRDLSGILQLVQSGPLLWPALGEFERRKGITLNFRDRATKAYAQTLAPFIDEMFGGAPPAPGPSHSDAIVVVDRWGNVAALVHSINSVVWGATGMVVGGVPISDAAGFNQFRLENMKPGGRVPNEMAPIIVMKGTKPVLATAAIGASLTAETVRLLVGTLGNRLDAATVMAAPPLLFNYGPLQHGETAMRRVQLVSEGAYDSGFLKSLQEAGVAVQQKSPQDVRNVRGTAVVGAINPNTGRRGSVQALEIFVFATAY